MSRISSAYGKGQPGIDVFPKPIVSLRSPGVGDVGFDVGQLWVNTILNQVFCLTGYTGGQAQWVNPGGTSAPDIEFLQGDAGGAVGPDPVSFTIDIIGTGPVVTTGNPGTNTMAISVDAATEVSEGIVELATAVETTTGTSNSLAVHPAGLDTKLGTQTANGLMYGRGGPGFVLGALAAATDGQIPIGSTGFPPTLATITAGTGINVLNSAGAITLSVSGLIDGSAQTIGAVTADIITIPLAPIPGVYSIEATIDAFESTTPAGAGYKVFGMVRTDGVAATLVGVPNQIVMEEAALAACDATIVVVGNTAIIRSTGVALLTVEWDAIAIVTFGN